MINWIKKLINKVKQELSYRKRMKELKRLFNGTIEILGFLINVTVVIIVLMPILVFLILPAYIMDTLTRTRK